MTIQFGPKTVTLVANVQNTLTWGLADFANTLGQAHGIIRDKISLSFQAVNNTAQVCYIGLSYTTIKNSFNVSDRKSIAAVPANGSLNITPLTTPSLAIIGPDIVSITMTLISAAAGTIVINLQADNPQPSTAGGPALFGLDNRSIQDYINQSLIFDNVLIGIGATTTLTYTVPSGKRAIIDGYYGILPITPIQPGELEIAFSISGIAAAIFRVQSSDTIPIVFGVTSQPIIADSGKILGLTVAQNVLYNKTSALINATMIIREIF